MARAGTTNLVVVLGILILGTIAHADPPAPDDVVVLMAGQTASFSGVLVPEDRFEKYLRAEMEVESLRFRLNMELKAFASLEDMMLRRLEDATKPTPWYERPSFNRWLGFGIGVVVTGFLIWGGVEFVGQMAGR